jgi:integrating conjugative element protein (TIGR03749 family)
MSRLIRLLAALAAVSLVSAAQAVELVRWERLPLAVPLVIGQERVIFVDRPVKVGLERSLTGKLRVHSAGGTVYLLASQPIAPTRVQLQTLDSGEIILMDIAASPGEQALEPLRILSGAASEDAVATPASSAPAPQTPVPVALARFAAQSLYAPLRTVEPLPGVRRVPLRLRTPLATLLPTEPVTGTPLAAWRLDDYWVTAVRLTNHEARTIALDPRRLQGQFYAAAFQHDILGPARTAQDTSVVYLVTRGAGLEQALFAPLPEQTEGATRDEK